MGGVRVDAEYDEVRDEMAPGDVRGRLDVEAFFDWLYRHDGAPYDAFGAFRAGSDLFDRWGFEAREDFSKLFCSELVAAALEAGGALPSINASEVHPMDVARMQIFEGRYYQLAGEPTEIPGFNSLPLDILPRLFPVTV